MRAEIKELRKQMDVAGVDAYYVPYSDFHCSEYVSDYFKVTEFLSGFTGESATLIVTADDARLWTDGRFFIQAEYELKGSGIEMMKLGEDGVKSPGDFIVDLAKSKDLASEAFVLGFDGRVVPASFILSLNKKLKEAGAEITIKSDEDLAGGVWKERPEINAHEIWEFPISSAGLSSDEKINSVRKAMKDEGADHLVITDLMETAWLFNLRGSDILCTPVFFSFTMISEENICLYVIDDTLESRLGHKLRGVEIKAYEKIYEAISAIRGSAIWLDSRSCSYGLMHVIDDSVKVIDKRTPIAEMKIIKNATEIECSKRAHIRDGVAVAKLIKWLKDTIRTGEHGLTELDISANLHRLRSEQEGFIEESFETISAYGSNGAIIHYAPNEQTNAVIKPDGFLLLDSGGQYIDGTTDITRTVAVGPLSPEMIRDYTLVLKAHIAMAMFEVKCKATGELKGDTKETSVGIEIDRAARKPLQEYGLDFNHGLSHGVGHVLGVHEGPNAISTKDPQTELKAGMIMSDEPGVYLEDKFGIRIENLVLWKKSKSGSLINEPLTCVPYERAAIDVSLLTPDEIRWINEYHSWVRETLSPFLDKNTAEYLDKATRPLCEN